MLILSVIQEKNNQKQTNQINFNKIKQFKKMIVNKCLFRQTKGSISKNIKIYINNHYRTLTKTFKNVSKLSKINKKAHIQKLF